MIENIGAVSREFIGFVIGARGRESRKFTPEFILWGESIAAFSCERSTREKKKKKRRLPFSPFRRHSRIPRAERPARSHL